MTDLVMNYGNNNLGAQAAFHMGPSWALGILLGGLYIKSGTLPVTGQLHWGQQLPTGSTTGTPLITTHQENYPLTNLTHV